MGEFDLIRRYFQRPVRRKDVVLGSGDDCALLSVPAESLLAVSTDTLVCGVHFFADMDPVKLGHKALAVNLSDLAAMGAEPRWASLALTLPAVDEVWLEGFARGFLALAEAAGRLALANQHRAVGCLEVNQQHVPAVQAHLNVGA